MSGLRLALLSRPQRISDTAPTMVRMVASPTARARALRRRRPSGSQRIIAQVSMRSSRRRPKLQTSTVASRVPAKAQRCPGAMALSKAARASAFNLSSRRRSSSVGRIRVDQKLGLNGVAARLLICELNRLRRRLTICAARSRDDWPSWVAWRSSSSRAFFCRVRVWRWAARLSASSGCGGPITFNWSSSRSMSATRSASRASAWRWTCNALWRNSARRSSLASAVTRWRTRSSCALSWSRLASSARAGGASRSTAACGAGLAAQASLPRLRSRHRAMANWQSNICRLARLIESPFRS